MFRRDVLTEQRCADAVAILMFANSEGQPVSMMHGKIKAMFLKGASQGHDRQRLTGVSSP
jgi:hypothetical protein